MCGAPARQALIASIWTSVYRARKPVLRRLFLRRRNLPIVTFVPLISWRTTVAVTDAPAHGRARDVRRADRALAVAADRAHLVEGQCAALFDAAAEVDLDSLTGRHPVLLVAIVDDGEHWTASWSAAALAAERAWHDSDRRPSFKAAGAERAEPGARRAGSLLAGLLLLLLLDEQQFDRARQRLAAQVAEADHALVVEHEDRRPAADPPAGRDRAARPLGAAPEAAPRDAVLLRLGVELVEV